MSWIVKLGKKGKKIVKKIITPAEKHYVGYTRRIERVKTGERICAMTFDDGPMGLPASPDRFERELPRRGGQARQRGVGRRQIRPLPRYPLRRQGRSRA